MAQKDRALRASERANELEDARLEGAVIGEDWARRQIAEETLEDGTPL